MITPARRASVLAIDDNDAILMIVRMCLENSGYEVTCVNRREALMSALGAGHFDLALTDLLMPDMDGAEVIALIRQYQPDAAILVMTGSGDELPAAACVALGGSAAANPIQKPFTLEELLDAVAQALPARRDAAAVPT